METMVKLPCAKYKDWRQNIDTGDLLLCMGNSKISKGIKWTESKMDKVPMIFNCSNKTKNIKGFITHVGVFVKVLGQIFIVEANGKIVAFTRFSRIYKGYKGHLFIVRPKITFITDRRFTKKPFEAPFNNVMLASRSLEVEGAKYDWKSIWRQLIRVFNKEVYKKNKYHEELFCSELVNMASGYFYADKEEWCTPHDIALQSRDNFLVMITDVK